MKLGSGQAEVMPTRVSMPAARTVADGCRLAKIEGKWQRPVLDGAQAELRAGEGPRSGTTPYL